MYSFFVQYIETLQIGHTDRIQSVSVYRIPSSALSLTALSPFGPCPLAPQGHCSAPSSAAAKQLLNVL